MTSMRQKTDSLWNAQLGALGFADRSAPGAAAEKALLSRVILPELALQARPEQGRFALPFGMRSWAFAAVGAAAILAGILVFKPADGDWTGVKGSNQVRLYWEREGVVHHFEPGDRLETGDRVRAEIDAENSMIAYWLVTGRDGRAQVDTAFVLASAVAVKAGESAPFAQGLRLTGESSGETLTVLICPAAIDAAQMRAAVPGKDAPVNLTMLTKKCAARTAKLRP